MESISLESKDVRLADACRARPLRLVAFVVDAGGSPAAVLTPRDTVAVPRLAALFEADDGGGVVLAQRVVARLVVVVLVERGRAHDEPLPADVASNVPTCG